MPRRHLLPLAALLLLFAAAGPAAAAPDPAGVWLGSLQAGGATLRLRFDITGSAATGLAASMTSLDQSSSAIPARIVVDGAEVRVRVPSISGVFAGTLSTDGDTLAGRWSQLGQDLPLVLTRDAAAPAAVAAPLPAALAVHPWAAGLPGTWIGALHVNVIELRLQFHLTDDDGELGVTMDSLDQGESGIPALAELHADREVVFRFPSAGAHFRGTLDAAGDTLRGEWVQAGQEYPLVLGRTAGATRLHRPQEPQPPFPYTEVAVSFAGGAEGVTLAGTLTLPPGEGPFPAAVLVSGSGPQNRDEELLGHKPFLVLADHLARAGIAVLRCDDRGVAGSTGNFSTATTADFAADAAAAVGFARRRAGIDSTAVGIVGHSEGAMVAPMVAAGRGDLGWIVMLAGPGVSGREILTHQTALLLRADGAPEDRITAELARFETAFAAMDAEPDPAEQAGRIKAELLAREAGADPDTTALTGLAYQFATPWFRWFLAQDPAAVIAAVPCPVLALWGGLDLQVDPAQNLPAVEKALSGGRSPQWEVRELPGLNHLFQTATTGAMSEYGRSEETMAPAALEAVSTWIRSTTGR
ncbi:alpha/beta hydrolase [bacterium]|nr:alpha/beta hydrolase [bacterium]